MGSSASILVCALLAAGANPTEPTPRWTTPQAAFEAGRKAYLAERYAEAIEAFEAAYVMHPEPKLLANLAAAHRLQGACGLAISYYDAFLDQEPASTTRDRIAKKAANLRATCRQAIPRRAPVLDEVAAAEPAPTESEPAPPRPPEATSEADVTRADRPAASGATPAWQLSVEGSAVLGRWGDASSTSPGGRLGVHHTWWWGRIGVSAGLAAQLSRFEYSAASFAPEPYTRAAWASESVIEVQAKLQALSWLGFGLEVGGGLTWFSGFEAWNQLAEDGAASAGGVVPTARVGASAQIGVADALAVRLTLFALSVSPGPAGVDATLLSMSFGAGLAYGF